MSYGLRFYTKSTVLGTSFDYLVPDADIPSDDNTRGYKISRDEIETPSLNTFLYDKGKIKEWTLLFEEVQTITKTSIEHCSHGWFGNRQVSVIFFGTQVFNSPTLPLGSYDSSQCWGTCYITMSKQPHEKPSDAWTFEIYIKQFGAQQTFS